MIEKKINFYPKGNSLGTTILPKSLQFEVLPKNNSFFTKENVLKNSTEYVSSPKLDFSQRKMSSFLEIYVRI
jgi:hypothetical protein